MANPDIGTVKCPFDGSIAPVRKYKNDLNPLLYFNCPRCGIIRPNLAEGQEWILANATITGAQAPVTASAPAPVPETPYVTGQPVTEAPAAPPPRPAPAKRAPVKAAPMKKSPASPVKPATAPPRRSLLPDL